MSRHRAFMALEKKHEAQVTFATRQALDAPSRSPTFAYRCLPLVRRPTTSRPGAPSTSSIFLPIQTSPSYSRRHNGGNVSEPGHKGRRYRIRTKRESDRFVDPQTWIRDTLTHEGSWWPAWVEWLSRQSGKRVTPPVVGAAAKGLVALADAPGTYILQR